MPFNNEDENPSFNFSSPSVLVNMSPHCTEDSTLTNSANTLSPQEETALKGFRYYAKENGYCQLLEDGQPAVDDTTLL